MKNHSTVAIPMFQNLGTGRWYYSFNHKEEMVKDEDGADEVIFTADTVVMSGEPTEQKIKEAMTSDKTDKGDINPITYEVTEAPVEEDVSHVISYTDDVYRSVLREDIEGLEWIENEMVHRGQKRDYAGKTWECIQYHITQLGWEPDRVPALWKEYHDINEIIDWYQPTGAHDAFRIDALVRYIDGKVYRSLIDYNVYSPEAYPSGWELTDYE